MKIFIEKDREEKEIKFEGTVVELLKKLSINKETVIVIRGDELVAEDEKLSDSDEVKILSVISGG